MVQPYMPEDNTFLGFSMTRNTHNNLLKQDLQRKRQLGGFRKELPRSEPSLIFSNCCSAQLE